MCNSNRYVQYCREGGSPLRGIELSCWNENVYRRNQFNLKKTHSAEEMIIMNEKKHRKPRF